MVYAQYLSLGTRRRRMLITAIDLCAFENGPSSEKSVQNAYQCSHSEKLETAAIFVDDFQFHVSHKLVGPFAGRSIGRFTHLENGSYFTVYACYDRGSFFFAAHFRLNGSLSHYRRKTVFVFFTKKSVLHLSRGIC